MPPRPGLPLSFWTLTGCVPCSLKTAAITVLKKTGVGVDDFKNYRPISNLPFIDKLLEYIVVFQLQEYLTQNYLWEVFWSGFKANDLLMTADRGHVSILLLLDLTVAFETVCLLLTRLETLLGITGIALSCFNSYITDYSRILSLSLTLGLTTLPIF